MEPILNLIITNVYQGSLLYELDQQLEELESAASWSHRVCAVVRAVVDCAPNLA